MACLNLLTASVLRQIELHLNWSSLAMAKSHSNSLAPMALLHKILALFVVSSIFSLPLIHRRAILLIPQTHHRSSTAALVSILLPLFLRLCRLLLIVIAIAPPLPPTTDCSCNCNCSNKKKQKPSVNLVSKVINGIFGVLAVLFLFSVRASFEELPVDKQEESEAAAKQEESEAATELQNPPPSSSAAPQSDSPKKKTRPATRLDKWMKVSDD